MNGRLLFTKGMINRAMIACENSGLSVSCDFAEVNKIVKARAGKLMLDE